MDDMHHFVIVGGGAGGLELATKLGNKLGKKNKARITLVDAALTHVWKPLLHEVAAGSLNSDAAQVDFRVHAQQHYFEFQPGRLTGLDRSQKTITLAPINNRKGEEVVAARRVPYDTLVIAVGSTTNDFGTKGAEEHCQFLDSQLQARRFHQSLLNRYLQAEHAPEGERDIHVAIIGGGATGVELAAELRYASQQLES
ncbi:NAD(P)/FAD-dependent oxidoreductase, partial [Oleiphilus sp. HI0066]|uniref:NAD(P)/FAD-dependent oxidoreductase n=3 Tax=Oleiphilus TaxID=141450 RepID=UPI000B0429CB